MFLSGCIASNPCLIHREGAVAHLTFSLDVMHRTSKGENRHEQYPISLWHNAALWAAQALKLGQRVAVTGYLAIRRAYENGIEVRGGVEVAADEVFVMVSHANEEFANQARSISQTKNAAAKREESNQPKMVIE
ncbi:MAG: single-stranded DNA-binding protein [Clostridia bacterium]